MKLGEHQEAFAVDLVRLLIFAMQKGYGCRLREVQRRPEMQKLYVEMQASLTLNSQHIHSLAVDVYFTKEGQIVYDTELGRYWESLSPLNRAGMFWKKLKDFPHFERKP